MHHSNQLTAAEKRLKGEIEMKELHSYGKSLIGKTAQSRLLTGISSSGKQFILPAHRILSYHVEKTHFNEPTLFVTVDSGLLPEKTEVPEESLFNINY